MTRARPMLIQRPNLTYETWNLILDRNGLTYDVVADFGAKGNGSDNDTTPVQNAINAARTAGGGIVFFPEGTSYLLDPLTLYSNVALIAVNRSVTLTARSGTGTSWAGFIRADGSGSTQASNMTISGLVIDASTFANPAVTLTGCADVLIHNCLIKGTQGSGSVVGGVALIGGNNSFGAVPNCNRIRFRECEIGPIGGTGIGYRCNSGTDDIAVITDVWIENCYVHDSQFSGIGNWIVPNRGSSTTRIFGCRFENNGLVGGGTQYAHINDDTKTGWVDFDVAHNYFGTGNSTCGGVSDHHGRNIRIHHNHFEMKAATNGHDGWWIALGDDRTFAVTARTWFAWVQHNYVTDCFTCDFDSCRFVYLTDNIFYRNRSRPIGAFGEHKYTFIDHNSFIENGLNPPDGNAFHGSGFSCGRGITARNNLFRDDQVTQTQLYGIYEIAGDTDFVGAEGIYENNNFANTPTPMLLQSTYDDERSAQPDIQSTRLQLGNDIIPPRTGIIALDAYEIGTGSILELAVDGLMEVIT